MESRRDYSLLWALTFSLLLHGSAGLLFVRVYDHSRAAAINRPPFSRPPASPPSPVYLPDAAAPAAHAPRPAAAPPPITTAIPAMPPPAPLLPAGMDPPLLIPKAPPVVEPQPQPSAFGELKGKGIALHSSPGEELMRARYGPLAQAFLSRDETGKGSRGLSLPQTDVSRESLTKGRPGDGEAAAPLATEPKRSADGPVPPPAPAAAAMQHPERSTDLAQTKVTPLPDAIAVGGPAITAPRPKSEDRLQPNHHPASVQSPTTRITSSRGQPGAPGPAAEQGEKDAASADPAPLSDSESDAFSTQGSAVFKNGRLEAACGRKVKTVRPQLSLAGQYDLLKLRSPSVALKVKVDATGRVRHVEVAQSSGSSEVDQSCELAMYDWWFEPALDKSGRPQPSEMTWTFIWR